MPSAGDKFRRYAQYALGIVAESGWILALTLLGFVLAVLAKVIWP
jgi:hypothetical protein